MLSAYPQNQAHSVFAQSSSSTRKRYQTTRERRQPRYLFVYLVIAVILFDEFAGVAAGRSYYDILGVSRDADSATIKRAFRKLAVKYHPDKNPGDKDAEKMYVELNNAYEVLADSNKRQRYDMYGEEGVGSGDQGDEDEFDPFGSMFGFGRRQRRHEERRVKDVTIPLSVTLETLYNGGVIEAVHKRRVICARWGECEKKCDKCGGTGYIITTRRLGPGFVQQMRVPCPVCGGTGKIGIPNCKGCPKGQFEEDEKQLLIDIERGMTDGQTITFDSQTDEVPDHVPGNVHFEISTQEHDTFKREGNDLHYNLEISLSEALVGVDRVVKQLDGRLVEIKTDKVISPAERIEIEGEGMPSMDGGPAGNMIVEFWVKFPDSLTDKQKELAIELHGKPPRRKETEGETSSSEHQEDAEKAEL